MSETGFDQIFPTGESTDAFVEYLTGQSYLAPLTEGSVPVSNEWLEPVTVEVYGALPRKGNEP